MKSEAIPELRFTEFLGKWKHTPLSALLKQAENRKVQKPTSRYTELGIRSHGKGFIIRENTSPNKNVMTHLFEVKSGDISINISFAWEGAVALAGGEHEGGLVSHRFPLFQVKPDMADPNYLYRRFKLPDFTYRLELYSPGGAGRNRVLKKSDLLNSKIYAPAIAEQKKIAAFLTAVDQKLEALEIQISSWREFKRGMMQALLAKSIQFKANDGSNFPEWKTVKLKKIANFTGGGTPSKSVKSYWQGSLPWVSSSDMVENHLRRVSIRRHISELGVKSSATKKIPAGSLLLVTRVGVGKVAIAPTDVYASQDFTALTDLKANAVFLGYQLLARQREFKALEQGSTIKGIPLEVLKVFDIKLPSVSEQEKIADYLSALDLKIDALNDRLNTTREFKRGLLQKMFV